jgi:type III secretory pathway lipoprotein EscJ
MFSIVVFISIRNNNDDDTAVWTIKYLIEDSVV